MTRKPLPSLKSRAIGLKNLIADGLTIGFSSSLIGSYKGQLKAVEKEINDDKSKKEIFKRGLSPSSFHGYTSYTTRGQKLKLPPIIITSLKGGFFPPQFSVISIKRYGVTKKTGLMLFKSYTNPFFFFSLMSFYLKDLVVLRLLK